jgi:hypothetical protein
MYVDGLNVKVFVFTIILKGILYIRFNLYAVDFLIFWSKSNK